jgi:hypothetical protein
VPFDATRKIRRRRNAEAAGELRPGLAPRELEQRERVAVRLGDDPVAHALVDRARDDGREQRARVLLAETGERQLRQPVELAPPNRLTDGEDQRDRFSEQPPGYEAEDLAGHVVQPLGVIDHAEQRPLLRDRGQEAEHGQSDEEVVPRLPGRQA